MGGEPFFHFDPRVKIIDLGIKIQDVLLNKENYFIQRFKIEKLLKLYFERLNIEINKIKPDIIDCFGDHDRLVAYKLDHKCKKILEHHFANGSFTKIKPKGNIIIDSLKIFLGKYKAHREKSFIDKYDRFMVLTEEDKNDWNDPRIMVIPNCLPFFPKESAKCENKKIVTVGRLVDQKGYDILLDVWKILAPKYPDWTLEVYGEGEKRKELEEKRNSLGLNDSFLLKGAVQNIKDKYLDSSIYVMSSRYEGFGMVLIEAMSCGLPVVSFACPCGPRDVIKDNIDGYLVENFSIEDMANKIEILINDSEKRKEFGRNAKENVKRFSEEDIMNRWKNLYEELLKK